MRWLGASKTCSTAICSESAQHQAEPGEREAQILPEGLVVRNVTDLMFFAACI